jgi:hypothetical protein
VSPTATRAQLKQWAEKAGPHSPLHALVKATKPARAPRVKPKDLPPSQGRILRIVVPMPDALTNAGRKSRHFMTAAKRRRAYYKLLDRRAEAGLIPPAPDGGFGRVTITSVMYLGGRMDHDNAMARHKWPIDWLQKNGYLVNDRYASWTGFPEQVVKQGQEYRIELELREP